MIRRIILLLGAVVMVIGAVAAIAVYWILNGDTVRLAIERQATNWLGQPVRIEGATAQLFPRIGVRLTNVRAGEPVRLTLPRVEVSTGLRELLSRRIEGAELLIADSRLDLPLPFELPTATASAPSSSGPAITIGSIRRIRLSNVRITSRGREITIDVDSSLTGSHVTLSRLSAMSGRTAIDASGVAELSPAVDVQIKASAKRLDLDDLVALANAFGSPTSSSTTRASSATSPSTRLLAQVTADVATAAGLDVRQLATTVRVQGTRVSLSPTTFLLFGGRYQGDLDVELGNATSMTWKSRFSDIDVSQVAAFGGVADTVTGKLSAAGTFSGRGADIDAVLASLRGSGTASIVDGTIRRLNLVRTVVVFFGRPAPASAAATDAFQRMDARFALDRDVVTTEAFSLRSPDVDVVGTGTLSLDSKALDGRADLSLSEALSKEAGTDLYRYTREGNRIVLPATIGGTVSAPRVSIDATAAVRRGLRNEIDRRLKGLVDRFR